MDVPDSPSAVVRRVVERAEADRASRRWWDSDAADYLQRHGDFLGAEDLVWGPEGLHEEDLGLLGDVSGRTVLEVGCGAAQCARWLTRRGARVIALDLSGGMLREGRRLNAATGLQPALVQADAQRLPLGDATVDLACSAFGAIPFVTDSAAVTSEVARVLRPGGRWVFAATHPFRWCFLDDPGDAGLVVAHSYFDRTPYVEEDADGRAVYVEHHRTFGDRVREIVGAGLRLVDLVEPEWPAGQERAWAQWSPHRGRLMPGTAIYVTDKPA